MAKDRGMLRQLGRLCGQKRALMACLKCTTCVHILARSRLLQIRLSRCLSL